MIECIRTYRLQHKLDEPFGFSQWHYDTRNALLVEVIDSSGVNGWGECYGPAEVTQSAISSFYAPLLIGWNPLQNEAAWQHCWRASLDFARKGIMMGAISGLDMALFDLKGKHLCVSASELMGGRVRDTVQCYATGMYFRKKPETQLTKAIINEAGKYVKQGYKALKIKVGKNIAFDKQLIATMRQEFPDTQLMAEEPLSPENVSLFRELSDKLDIPIATGECEQTRWGFQELLSKGGVQIAQPDLSYCGGPTEALKIRTIASSLGINTVPHAWGTMLNLASATHFLASTNVEPGRAEVAEPLLEVDRTPNPMRDEMYTPTLKLSGKGVKVPTTPGLGVEPDLHAMETFCVNKTEEKK